MRRLLFAVQLLIILVWITTDVECVPGTCRVRGESLPSRQFQLLTCSQCHYYLFQDSNALEGQSGHLKERNGTREIIPDITNQTVTNLVCSHLNTDQCDRWLACCRAAITCCEWQQSRGGSRDESRGGRSRECPDTWDGFTCWGEMAPGRTAYNDCPDFLQYTTPGVKSYKVCTENGTWWTHPDNGKEHTDYTTCLDLQTQKAALAISMTSYLASIVLLLPATVIFLSYRALMSQHRIRLHLNLFIAFILNAFFMLLWFILVVHDKLTQPLTQSVIYRNTIPCRLLSTLTRYLGDTCFVWMFCEGLYLQQLLCNTFRPQHSLYPYYLFGWGFAIIPTVIYATLQGRDHDEACWMKNLGNLEWIHYAPNLLAIVLNFVFLCNILRILLTQLTAHPNEPSSYRRALKATFILVPLFGLQWFLTIYQPSYSQPGYQVVDMLHRVMSGLGGVFVSMIFCYFNHEVVCQLRRTLPCLRSRDDDAYKSTLSTQYTLADSRPVPDTDTTL